MRNKLTAYYHLIKPGIIRGNAITAAAGFLFASQGNVDFAMFIAMLGGIALVMASGCVFNNYIDRGIDKKMKRTKKRALVTGEISNTSALIYGAILGLLGLWLLLTFTNNLTAYIALFGFVAYVIIYGIAKRHTIHGTAVGSLSGAVPPLVGYTAVTNQLDVAASLLFAILVCWQMPHFYAIAIFRMKEYAAANIPVLSIKKGVYITKVQIVLYIVAFIGACFALTALGYTGYVYMAVMGLLGIGWLVRAVRGFGTVDDDKWARKAFGFSLLVLLAFSFMISVDVYLP